MPPDTMMKFPDRPNGASGSLVRANLFDEAPTPEFCKTRQGSNIIHKRNGDLLVTRDAEQVTPPPWLLIPYSYRTNMADRFETLLHRLGLDDEDRIDQAVGSVPATDGRTAAGLVYVGGGWLLESYQSRASGTYPGDMHLRLRSVDDLEHMVDLGVRIQTFGVGPGDAPNGGAYTFGLSLCALGWQDAERGYGFAVMYYQRSTGRYVCQTGSTGQRAIGAPVALPQPPGGHGWLAPHNDANDRGYAKCCTVGRGHLLVLLVPADPIEYGRSGGIPQKALRPGYLPQDSSPFLLRSRDFGQTWAMEAAPFLTEDGIYEAWEDLQDPLSPKYDVPVRLHGWASNFHACPVGGGRVAMVAAGPTTSDPLEFDTQPWSANIAAQTLRFYVSNERGGAFVARAWPLDAGRNAFPPALGAPTPSTDTIISPLFGYGETNRYALGTLGPGTFFVLAEQVTRRNPGFLYGPYPAAYPLQVYVSRDFGITWAVEQIPAGAVPFADSFYAVKDGWASGGSPVHTGDGTQTTDSWLFNWLGICVTSPCDDLGRGGEVAFFTGEFQGPLALAVTTGEKTFASLAREVVVERSTAWTPHPSLVPGIPLTIYTGDALNLQRPESVWPGFPEFEDRT